MKFLQIIFEDFLQILIASGYIVGIPSGILPGNLEEFLQDCSVVFHPKLLPGITPGIVLRIHGIYGRIYLEISVRVSPKYRINIASEVLGRVPAGFS